MSAPIRQQTEQAHRLQVRRRRWQVGLGLALMVGGLGLLAVPATTGSASVMVRVVLGFVVLLLGFFVAIAPLLDSLMGSDD